MPRDIPTPLRTARFPAATLAYASERRAELFRALGRMSLLRKHGPLPWSRELHAQNVATVKAANRFAGVVLP